MCDRANISRLSCVTRYVPPYAIVVGSPGKVLRLRTSEALIERLQKLQWWRYDLAPHKRSIDFSDMEHATAVLEELLAAGKLQILAPTPYRRTRKRGRLSTAIVPPQTGRTSCREK